MKSQLLEKLMLLALVIGIVLCGYTFLKPQILGMAEKASKGIKQSSVEQVLIRG